MKIIIFGAGAFGRKYIQNCHNDEEIVAICDNNWENLTATGNVLFGHKIISPLMIKDMDYDFIVIAIDHWSAAGLKSIFDIKAQLEGLGVQDTKIVLMNNDRIGNEYQREYDYPRVQFVYDFAKLAHDNNVDGAVAECGVHVGDFAHHINRAFPDKRLYLFDTFESFPEADIAMEEKPVRDLFTSRNKTLNRTLTDELSLLKCWYRDNVIVKKGYVPETFDGISEHSFAFVHLDMDLYAPTAAALNFFSPRMSKGGVIAVHDYLGDNGFFTGVRKAVKEYNNASHAVPIGDGTSLAILF